MEKKEMLKSREELINKAMEQFEQEGLDSAIKELAEQMGVDSTDIKVKTEFLMSDILKKGVIVELHIGRKRAQQKLDKADIGLDGLSEKEYKEFEAEYLNYGRRRLLPAYYIKKFDNIEARARKYLAEWSYKTLWGYFVPHTTFKKIHEKLQELRDEYMAAKNELMSEYDMVIIEVLNQYEKAARTAYVRKCKFQARTDGDYAQYIHNIENRVRKENPNLPESTIIQIVEESLYQEVPQWYIDNFLEKIKVEIPTAEEFDEAFYFEYEAFYIPMPSLLAAEKQKIELLEEQKEITSKQAQELAEMEQFVRKQQLENRQKKMNQLFNDLNLQLRELIFNGVTDVLQSINNNNGKLVGRSALQLQRMVEKGKAFNFYDNPDVATHIREIESLLDVDVKERDIDKIEACLKAIAHETRKAIVDLGGQPRKVRNIGLETTNVVETNFMRHIRSNVDISPSAKVDIDTRQVRRTRTEKVVAEL